MLFLQAILPIAALLSPSPLSRSTKSPSAAASPRFGDPLELGSGNAGSIAEVPPLTAAAVGLAAMLAAQPDPAFAKGGEYGIFEGRIVSLAHPAVSTCHPPSDPREPAVCRRSSL